MIRSNRFGRRESKQNRQRTGAGALALTLAAVLGFAASAEARPHGGGCGGGPSLERLEHRMERLDLAPDTREAVYAVIDRARGEERALRTELRAGHERMRALLDQTEPARDEVLTLADSLGALETSARKLHLGAMVEIRALVTDAQWEALNERRRGGERPPPSAERAPL